jgi:acetyl esterase/lipase
LFTLLLCTLWLPPLDEPKPLRLWEGKAPHAVGDDPADVPMLTPYLPPKDKATGTAVVVCPGGGYGFLAVGHEGKEIAEWLNQRGIAAFVLKYRIVTKGRPGPLHPAPMLDVQRAIRTIRTRASEWGVDPKKVGVWGFSAGGHLASIAATHFESGNAAASDPIDHVSSRPDFAILSYPVISMKTATTHGGARNNLLGKDADPALVESLSSDQVVTKHTPPTFLFHTDEDTPVPPMNSISFYAALKKHGVAAELHIYEKGKHGVGLASKAGPAERGLNRWPELLNDWLIRRGLCK